MKRWLLEGDSFHGVRGNEWIDAEIKPVTDGNRRTAPEYVSGFHIDIKQGLWDKEHSPANILLREI